MLSNTWSPSSAPSVILYVDGAILLVLAVMYMFRPGHSKLEGMIGLPPSKGTSADVVSMLFTIDGFSKFAVAILMILSPVGRVSSSLLLAFVIAHLGWAFLQFDQAIRFHAVLRQHAQPNIGCLQVMFAAALFYYVLEGEGVWPSMLVGVVVCSVAAVVLCAAGLLTVYFSTRGVPGGEHIKGYADQLLE